MEKRTIKRGEVYMANTDDMSLGTTHVMQKDRAVLIIQNNIGNIMGGTVVCALITTQKKKDYPMHFCYTTDTGIPQTVMFEHIVTLDKDRLDRKIGELDSCQTREANEALMTSLQLTHYDVSKIKEFFVKKVVIETEYATTTKVMVSVVFYNLTAEAELTFEEIQTINPEVDATTKVSDIKKVLDSMKGVGVIMDKIHSAVH